MMSKQDEREQRLAYEKSVDTRNWIAPVPDVSLLRSRFCSASRLQPFQTRNFALKLIEMMARHQQTLETSFLL
jgi:hypothetical protein